MNTRSLLVAIGLLAVGTVFGHTWARQAPPAPPEWTKKTAEHAKLAESVGDWDVQAKMYAAPGAPPTAFAAKAQRKMIMGGYFLEEHFSCQFMGQPFEGRLIQGYDTLSKEYVNIWIDNMSPTISVGRGKAQVDGSVVTMGTEPDYMTGKSTPQKSVMKVGNENTVQVSMFEIAEDGSERPKMEFHYTRQK